MTERFKCPKCGHWFVPDEHDDPDTNLCRQCETGEADENDDAGEDFTMGLRDVGDIEDHYRGGGDR